MLDMLNKKDLVARAKKMRATAQASPAKDLKLKTVPEVVPSDDEETYFGPVSKRRRMAVAKTVEHSALDGRARSPQAFPPSSPPSDGRVVQESAGASVLEGGLWDPNLDAPTFLEKTLLSV